MYLNSLRQMPRAPLSLGVLLTSVCAQSTALPGQAPVIPPAPAASPTPSAAKSPTAGLPEFLILVPGGTIEVGLTADALLNAAAQVVSPTRPQPAIAAKVATETYLTAVRRTMSAFGRRKVDVEPFLLARSPVTCAQYDAILKQRRAQGQKLRAPWHEWRYGRKDHYDSVLQDIQKEFPKDPNGPLLYWERHGAELPYELKGEKGESIADHPVTFVDYREANDFAGYLGMRLPSEYEWIRAARGDGTNMWPWGKTDPAKDVFTEEALKGLRLYNSNDKVLKPVGTVPDGTGPYGHVDMFGQIWQMVSGLGYRPINGVDAFATEWKALQKDKVGALVQSAPTWKENRVITKGGSYLSAGEPIQFLIDGRANIDTIEVFMSVGFRLAKTPRPGYDMLYSLLRGTYNRGPFGNDQDIDLTGQVGAERYELGADGFPTSYHAVSFAPVNGLTNDKTLALDKLLEKTHTSPIVLGTLATTCAMLEPAAPAGHYTVLFRKEGMPRELTEAIKAGHKELASGKPKPKAEEPTDDEGDAPKDGDKGKEGKPKGKGKEKDQERKPNGWRDLVARHGLTDEDIASKEASNGLKFVRMNGTKVPTDRDQFLLHDNDGKVVAAIAATNHKPTTGNPFPAALAMAVGPKEKAVVQLHFGAPLATQNPKKIVDFHLHVTLDRAVPAADAPWRMP